MGIRAVVAIGPALWLFVDRMASTHMGEPLTWDEILNLDNDSGATFNGNGLPTQAISADPLGEPTELLSPLAPIGLQVLGGGFLQSDLKRLVPGTAQCD